MSNQEAANTSDQSGKQEENKSDFEKITEGKEKDLQIPFSNDHVQPPKPTDSKANPHFPEEDPQVSFAKATEGKELEKNLEIPFSSEHEQPSKPTDSKANPHFPEEDPQVSFAKATEGKGLEKNLEIPFSNEHEQPPKPTSSKFEDPNPVKDS